MKTILASLVLGFGCVCAWAVKPAPTPVAADPIAHPAKTHAHNEKCGHTAVKHDTHMDYIDNGEFHAQHANHFDNHGLAVSASEPAAREVAANHKMTTDEKGHAHNDNCGHKKVQHGDHFDFIHNGHYHAVHADHTDEHGNI